MRVRVAAVLWCMAVWTGAVPGHAAAEVISPTSAIDMFRTFNTIVLNDHTASSETEGLVFVGGNMISNGYTVNTQSTDPIADFGGGVRGRLIVGGNVSGGDVNAGGGGGGAYIGGTATTNLNNFGTVTTGQGGVPVQQVRDTFTSLSADIAAILDTPGSVFNTADQNNLSITSVPGEDGIAVVSVAGSALATGTFTGVNAPPGATTIVNVSGQTVNIGMNANTTFPNVLFNFYEALTVSYTGPFNFSALAPLANVTAGNQNGTLVAWNLNQIGEIRRPPFAGELPPPGVVPLPAPALLLLSALAGLAVLRRRG